MDNVITNMNNKCIVFGHEHHNSLGQVRSLGEYGINPIVVTFKGEPKITSKSKYVKEKHYVDSIDEGFKLIVEKWGKEKDKPFIFTSDDEITSYLDERFDSIKDKFYFNNCSKQGEITHFMDKQTMYSVASSLGFKVPFAFSLDKDTDFSKIDYPIISKTKTSLRDHWKDDSYVIRNETELKTALGKIKSNDIIFQKYIEKKNELCLEGYSYNQGKDLFIALGLKFKYFVEGAYAHYLDCFNFSDKELIDKVSKLISLFGYEGVFEVEFLEDQNGDYYFLEINFRNSAWGYATTVAGMSTAIGWIKSKIEGKNHKPVTIPIKKGFTAMSEFADFRIRVLGKMIKRFEWKKQLKACDCTFYYNKNDKAPFRHAFYSKIFKKVFNK